MAQIVYQGQKYELLDPYMHWTRPESSFIRKKTGLLLGEIMHNAQLLDPDSICALLYVAKKRAGEKVNWGDFDGFTLGDCEFIKDDEAESDESDQSGDSDADEGGADPTSPGGKTQTRGSTTTSRRSRSSSTSAPAKSTS